MNPPLRVAILSLLALSSILIFTAPAGSQSSPAASPGTATDSTATDASLGTLLALDQPLVGLAASANGRRFAVATEAGELRVFSLDGAVQAFSTAGTSVRALALSADGALLVTASGDGRVRIWNVERKRLMVQFPGKADELGSVAWSPDARTIAVGGYIPDATTGQALGRLVLFAPVGIELRSLQPETTFVDTLAFSPDGKWLAAGGPRGQLSLFDLGGAALDRHLSVAAGERLPAIESIAFSPDGSRMAAGLTDGSIRLWSTADLRPLPAPAGGGAAHGGKVNALVFAPDGLLLASGGDDLAVKIWTVGEAEPLATLLGSTGALTGLITGPGDELLSASADGSVRRWSWRAKAVSRR